MRKPSQVTDRPTDLWRRLLRAAGVLFQAAGAAAVLIIPFLTPLCTGPHAGAPVLDDAPGSGIVVRTEVTAVWVPPAFLDLARHQAGRWTSRSPEKLHTALERYGLHHAWYALTYRGYQLNGNSAEMTQVRLLSEAADHVDELRDVMAAASGKPPRHEDLDYSTAEVIIIPDALLAMDPREAVTRLRAGRAARAGSPLERGFTKSRLPEGALPHHDASGRPIQAAPKTWKDRNIDASR